jgi:hypothetical protein
MFKRVGFVVALAGIFAPLAWAQQPAPNPLPQPSISGDGNYKAEKLKEQSATEKQGAEQSTGIVKPPEGKDTQKEANTGSTRPPIETGDAGRASLGDKIAIIASGIAFGQFLALFWTILEMRWSSQRQLRAYLFLDGASLMDGRLLSSPKEELFNVPLCSMQFKNFGQTPAYRVIAWAKIGIAEVGNDAELSVPKLSYVRPSNVGSNGGFTKDISLGRPLTPEEIDDICNKRKAIYLYGRVEYTDAFNKKRFSNFKVGYAGVFPPPAPATFVFGDNGNDTEQTQKKSWKDWLF